MNKQAKITAVVLMLGAFISVLNQTLINPALPTIMEEFHIEATTAQWLVSGFTLVNAIVIAISAFLMDRFRTKQLFLSIFVLFLAGSLLASWGVNFTVLLIGRLLQAICAGIMMPLSMTIILLLFPHEKRGSAMGMYSLVIMVAPAIGPVLAGVLTDKVGWRIMFLVMAVLAGAIILLASLIMKNYGDVKQTTLDKPSFTMASLGLLALLYGFSLLGNISMILTASALVLAGVVILFLFVRRQLSLTQPFLQIKVLGNAQYRNGTIILMLIQASLAAATITLPIYIQAVRGMSATVSGMVMMPGAILGAVFGYFAGKLYDAFGARYVGLFGGFLLLLGSLGMALFDFDTTIGFMTAAYTLRSVGLMLANTPINMWSIKKLPDEILHHGNAVGITLRQVATTLCTAVMVSVMSFASSVYAAKGEIQSQMYGISMTYWLSVVIGLVALILVAVKVKNREKTVAAVTEAVYELDIAMRADPYTVSCDDNLKQVVEKFIGYKTSGLPIIDAQKHLIGFVSDGDVMRYFTKQDLRFVAEFYSAVIPDTDTLNSKARKLLSMNVMEIASPNAIAVSHDTPLLEVCEIFSRRKINKLPVTQNDILIGTISRGDIMRALMTRLPLGGEDCL